MIHPLAAVTLLAAILASPALAQSAPAPAKPALKGAAKVRADAEALAPLFPDGPARRFITAATTPEAVPTVGPRVLAYKKETRQWLTLEEANRLPVVEKTNWNETPCDETQYYETKYGSPLVYARVIEVAQAHGFDPQPPSDTPTAVMDFGYGTIGHLLIMGAMGIEPTGIDVDHFLEKIYAPERAAGRIKCLDARNSVAVNLINGQWPAQPEIADQVRKIRPQGFDLITSKNTLKNGYLHPTQPVDDRKLVKLGVSDNAFVNALFDALRPGGLLVIYNISPRPSRGTEPYKPWADGRSPFSKEMLTRAGFEVLAFDEVDDQKAESIFTTLGYPITDSNGEKDLFALFTVCRRPPQ
ncbi:MAG: hypothetical protein JNK58_03520 [Phycisphaerae bacterium]|nr:hypothetical protein [Phycisphaerae bacterium]